MESTDLDAVAARFRDVAPRSEFWSLRLVDERNEQLAVRRGVVQPPHVTYDSGAMITVWDGGGVGYASTSDLTPTGLQRAGAQALQWAHLTAGCHVLTAAGWRPQVREGNSIAGRSRGRHALTQDPRVRPARHRPTHVDWEPFQYLADRV